MTSNALSSVFGGLRVIETSNSMIGAHVGQLFADFGAHVIMVEPPGGSKLRLQRGFPFWGRGKESIELDLRDAGDRDVLRSLVAQSDVFVETFRPAVADRLGVSYESLAEDNPALIYASVTGFGSTGPYSRVKGYEALVFAKVGGGRVFAPAASRLGPAFASVPYCSWSAAQVALHGILAALFERGRSGRGQRIETSMVKAISAHDPYGWMTHLLTERYPEAFLPARPFTDDGQPVSPLFAFVLIALSADGQWLQFSQVGPHLFKSFMRFLELDWMFEDPAWRGLPALPEQGQRTRLWELMLEAVRRRTTRQWQDIFEQDHNVWAEVFRRGSQLFTHPQLVHDRQVTQIIDPERGSVRQPGPLVRLEGTPARLGRPAPRRNEHDARLRRLAAAPMTSKQAAAPSVPRATTTDAAPLAGVTVLELGIWYAGPYGATLLTDLGARVIKIEPLEGDPLRSALPFPESGAARVLQGKESVAVDVTTNEGREIVYEIARRSDVVLQAFRAGVAERLGVDAQTLRRVNPGLVYLNAPGYGVDGPCGDRPAFAPTIGAGSGLAMRNVGSSVPDGKDMSFEDVKKFSVRLATVNYSAFASSDGLGALGTATALLLGLVARQRGLGAQTMVATMLSTVAHALSDDVVEYENCPASPGPDPGLHGFGALYRFYQAAEGWICLAAPEPKEWARLAAALAEFADLASDRRFASERERLDNEAALADVLSRIFRRLTAAEWEERLIAVDIGCVQVTEALPEAFLQSEAFGRASNLLVDVIHPTFDKHPRLAPLVKFSRSAVTPQAGCLLGQHTDSVMSELGYAEAQIRELRTSKVLGE